MGSEVVQVLLIVVTGYLLGSIPTAYVIAKAKNIDIFTVGSGNMGSTNVMRALGTKWGIAVALIDILKGVVAISLARLLWSENTAAATTIAAIVVIVGHNWSLFAAMITGTLRGGKGAATAFGTLLMIAPVQVIVGMWLIGGAAIVITRYMSLGVLLMMGVAGIWLFVLTTQNLLPHEYAIYIFVVAAMTVYRFRENIQRLATGTERRIGERA